MSGAKKITTVFDDQLNAKIQRKFDLVFNDKSQRSSNEDFSDEIEFGSGQDDEFVMENNGKKNEGTTTSASEINLDFGVDEETSEVPEASASAKSATKADDDGLGFSLNFDLDAEVETKPEVAAAVSMDQNDEGGFTLDDSDIGSPIEFDEGTKKTVMVSTQALQNSNLKEFSLGTIGSIGGSAEHMSNEESKANIETTIKEIIRPKLNETKEIDISALDKTAATQSGLADIEDSLLDFREKTDSKVFDLESMGEDAFSVERTNPKNNATSTDSTGEFDIGALETDFVVSEEVVPQVAAPSIQTVQKIVEREQVASTPSMGLGGSSITTEDSMRFQATIRALREEREEMLAQIKNLKSESRELEQDNLTIKANLDEAKIEITILRKRHMVELEDIKYRLAMSEEKKAMADEKARQADMRREKLEQKVRIDFNQVKQREKELESKLELLSMDVDSQVQSRDQKILELRRKIDALEFNMENASIKEQKSLDDKRKLEDRLNKIMKTLRHSIKNLEDDIDHAHEDDDHQKEKN